MANNGRTGEILQSIAEIGAIVGGRLKQKVAGSPLAASIAQGATARARSVVPPREAAPAQVVSVTDREPAAGDSGEQQRDSFVEHGLKTVVASIPAIGRLLWKLTTDSRVPIKHKIILGGAAAYLLSPFDVIPDRIPGVGQLDDFAVVVAALDIVLNQTDADIVHSHWTGDPHTLDNIQRMVGIASRLRGSKVRQWMLREKA